MITLARKQGDNRLMAVLLLLIALILVYVICFHWFVLRHLDYNEEIGDLASQLVRFQRVASQKDIVESQLKSLQGRRSESNLFLEEGDFNEAAAAMSERLNQMVSTQADESCQIV